MKVKAACDFVVGEKVYLPEVTPSGTVRWREGEVTKVLNPETVFEAGNLVNVVVYLHRTNEFVSAHSNQVRKGGPGAWEGDK